MNIFFKKQGVNQPLTPPRRGTGLCMLAAKIHRAFLNQQLFPQMTNDFFQMTYSYRKPC